MLGLPDGIIAGLFDLDGVLTGTAVLHQAAWRATFDEFLRERDGAGFVPFTNEDYAQYVDGRPRYDGVREFLVSRGIVLTEGGPDDPPAAQTVHGIGDRKNILVQKIMDEQGIAPYPGAVRYLRAAREAGLGIAVVSSSANAAAVLNAAGLTHLIDTVIDGVVSARDGLRGKPAPDSFLAGAHALGVAPANAAVFEDALAGVHAGRAGGFGYVVGVDRAGQAEALRAHGADVVVADIGDLLGSDR